MSTRQAVASITVRSTVRITLLAAFGLLWIALPFWFLVVNSFKTEGDASVLSLAWPSTWNVVDNYRTVLEDGGYLRGLVNSLWIAIPTLAAVLILGSMAAWVYARSNARSLKFAYYASILSVLIPPAIIPTIFVLQELGLNGTRSGYMLTLAGTRMGIVIFLVTGFIRAIPPHIEEAAFIDGASRFGVYRYIVLPMVKPALFVAAVLLSINTWNDFFMSLYLLPEPERATLPVALFQFASATEYTFRWNLVFAHVILTNIPLLLMYVVFQRRVMSGLTEGAVTG